MQGEALKHSKAMEILLDEGIISRTEIDRLSCTEMIDLLKAKYREAIAKLAALAMEPDRKAAEEAAAKCLELSEKIWAAS